jgi:hypothetical protein
MVGKLPTLHVLLLPLLSSSVHTAPTSNKLTLVDNSAFQCNSYPNLNIVSEFPRMSVDPPLTPCPRSQHTYLATSVVSHESAFPYA